MLMTVILLKGSFICQSQTLKHQMRQYFISNVVIISVTGRNVGRSLAFRMFLSLRTEDSDNK